MRDLQFRLYNMSFRTKLAFRLIFTASFLGGFGPSEGARIRKDSVEGPAALRSVIECRSISEVFVGIKLGEKHTMPVNKVNGQDLQICANHATCCTRPVEEKLHEMAMNQTQDVITSSSSNLKHHLVSNTRLFREQFLEMLSASENNTKTMLTSTFKIPIANSNSYVERLFSTFTGYVRHDEHANVGQSIDQFLDAIFPALFMYPIHGVVMADISNEYRECLTSNRHGLVPPPFGEVGRRLVQDVAKSMEVARSLLDAFSLAVEVINMTSYMDYERYCSLALTRLLYCSLCEGYSGVYPCRNYCLNVMHGCMAHVAEVDSHWNLFINAVEMVVTSMQGSFDFQDVLNLLHSKISESMMHFVENANKYKLQLISKCGYPFTISSSSSTTTITITAGEGRKRNSQPEEIEMKIHPKFSFDVIVQNFVALKGFFNKLPDSVCSSEKFSTENGSSCWNGTSIYRYLKPVPVLSFTTQVAENPEVQVPDALVPNVVKLIEKLNLMTKALNSRVIPRVPRMLADSSMEDSGRQYISNYGELSGSGSGSGSVVGPEDDEDSEESGSSSGSRMTSSIGYRPGHGGGISTRKDMTDFDFQMLSTTTTKAPPYKTNRPHLPDGTSRTASSTVTTSAAAAAAAVAAHLTILVLVIQQLLHRHLGI